MAANSSTEELILEVIEPSSETTIGNGTENSTGNGIENGTGDGPGYGTFKGCRRYTQMVVPGWNRQSSLTFVCLFICFLIWAVTYFVFYDEKVDNRDKLIAENRKTATNTSATT